MDSNEDEGVCYRQPKDLPQRIAIAADFVQRFEYSVPMLVDPMDNPAEEAYAGCDLVLVEGDRSRPGGVKIETWRAAVGGPCLAAEHHDVVAVVSDDAPEVALPVWPRGDVARLDALAEHAGNVTHAARALGVARQQLQRLIKKYGS